jgi:hypothetical protein
MRTPSLYSQDDPISAALKPPSTESDSERKMRILHEEQARLISEQIDEDLKLDRERLKRAKEDVKVRPHYSYPIHFILVYSNLIDAYTYVVGGMVVLASPSRAS